MKKQKQRHKTKRKFVFPLLCLDTRICYQPGTKLLLLETGSPLEKIANKSIPVAQARREYSWEIVNDCVRITTAMKMSFLLAPYANLHPQSAMDQMHRCLEDIPS